MVDVQADLMHSVLNTVRSVLGQGFQLILALRSHTVHQCGSIGCSSNSDYGFWNNLVKLRAKKKRGLMCRGGIQMVL